MFSYTKPYQDDELLLLKANGLSSYTVVSTRVDARGLGSSKEVRYTGVPGEYSQGLGLFLTNCEMVISRLAQSTGCVKLGVVQLKLGMVWQKISKYGYIAPPY